MAVAPSTLSELIAWINSCGIPDIDASQDVFSDTIRIRNRATNKIYSCSRLALEMHHDPKLMMMEMIASTMENPLDTIKKQLEAQDTYTMTQSLDNFSSVIRGAFGAPIYIDDSSQPPPVIFDNHEMKVSRFSQNEINYINQVKQTIRSLYETHCKELHDKHFLALNHEKIVIAGGCFVSLLRREEIKDIDVFFLDDEVNRRVFEDIKNAYEGDLNTRVGDSTYMNNENIEQTFTFDDAPIKIQHIMTKYKTRKELVDHFDFVHCCVSYDYVNDKLYMSRHTLDMIQQQKLVANNTKTPEMWRFEKFMNRGWSKLQSSEIPTHL